MFSGVSSKRVADAGADAAATDGQAAIVMARSTCARRPRAGATPAARGPVEATLGVRFILTSMRPARPLLRLVAVVLLLAGARAAVSASRERRFFSAHQGVGLEAPAGWTLSLHTGYPEILCLLLHPDGSRITLSASATKAPDAKALAEQSRRGLEAQHLAITRVADGPRGGVLVEARGVGRDAELRQLYIVRGAGAGKSQGVVLTLSTRAQDLAAAGPAFDWTVAHLVLEAPAGEAASTPDAGAHAAK
jgi:hypothetical protein